MRDRIVRKRLLLYVHSESLLSDQYSAIGKLVQVTEIHCLGDAGPSVLDGVGNPRVPGNAVVGHGFLSQPPGAVTDYKPHC